MKRADTRKCRPVKCCATWNHALPWKRSCQGSDAVGAPNLVRPLGLLSLSGSSAERCCFPVNPLVSRETRPFEHVEHGQVPERSQFSVSDHRPVLTSFSCLTSTSPMHRGDRIRRQCLLTELNLGQTLCCNLNWKSGTLDQLWSVLDYFDDLLIEFFFGVVPFHFVT